MRPASHAHLPPASANLREGAVSAPPTPADSSVGETLIPAVLPLTTAEQNILRRLIAGLSARDIASERGTSVKTVEAQVLTIKLKTASRTSYELGYWAGKNGYSA